MANAGFILLCVIVVFGAGCFTNLFYKRNNRNDEDKIRRLMYEMEEEGAYDQEEMNYRKRIIQYIHENIRALWWKYTDYIPDTIDGEINSTDLIVPYQEIKCGDHQKISFYTKEIYGDNCIVFEILKKTVMIVSPRGYIYAQNDGRENKAINKVKEDIPFYSYLEHDIPTIALVYIEHFLKNNKDEMNKYYHQEKEINDNSEDFDTWEKNATKGFIDQYKDQYSYNEEDPKNQNMPG